MNTADLDPNLVVVRADPLNCEVSLPGLSDGVVTPNERFYIRSHFPAPAVDPDRWRLRVGGLVKTSLSLGLPEILEMPAKSVVATLECAGNGRSMLQPAVPGEQWGLGAVSCAEWTGVPLGEVLRSAGIAAGAKEVVFRGADGGAGEPSRFERSLTLEEASDSSVLLAHTMNGESLPVQHGYPLRLIVPGWYAVTNVKWLTEIEVIDHAFRGHFQIEKYVYIWERESGVIREPVHHMRVRALIASPAKDETVETGALTIRGMAWSGSAPIARVEVDAGDGAWQDAQMLGRPSRHSWQRWELVTHVEQPGEIEIRARATDQAGRTQPEQAEWNRFGYGNNPIQAVSVRVARSDRRA